MSAHLFNGCCPDDTQPDSRDPECPACVEMSIPGQRIADLERRLELSEARRLDTVERSARVQYCQTCHGGMGFVAPEGEPCPWCRLAESEAACAAMRAALARCVEALDNIHSEAVDEDVHSQLSKLDVVLLRHEVEMAANEGRVALASVSESRLPR